MKSSILLWLIVLLAFVPGYYTGAEEEVSPALLEQLTSMDETVIELRALPMIDPVARGFPSRADVLTLFTEMFEEEFTDELIFTETLFYRAFDFVPADFDLATVYLTLMTDQIAGFYDTDTKVLNVVMISGDTLGDSLPPLERITYAHEFTHALQDQHFGLNAYLEEIEEPDAALAALALIEGDAMLITQEYTFKLISENPLYLLTLMQSAMMGEADMPEGTPPILEAELLMPYLQGLEFVTALYERGGWDMVNDAYANPPTSTAQILDPELYIADIQPQDVVIAPGDDVLGSGWELLIDRPLGVFYLREYLKPHLTSVLVNQAASGWDGDRFHLYHHASDDSLAWMLRIAWREVQHGDEFASAYEVFAASRLQTDIATYPADGMQCWEHLTESEALCLMQQGTDTLVASAPMIEQATALITGQLELAEL